MKAVSANPLSEGRSSPRDMTVHLNIALVDLPRLVGSQKGENIHQVRVTVRMKKIREIWRAKLQQRKGRRYDQRQSAGTNSSFTLILSC
jgi:hypothetical protein